LRIEDVDVLLLGLTEVRDVRVLAVRRDADALRHRAGLGDGLHLDPRGLSVGYGRRRDARDETERADGSHHRRILKRGTRGRHFFVATEQVTMQAVEPPRARAWPSQAILAWFDAR